MENIKLDGAPRQQVRARVRAQFGLITLSPNSYRDSSLTIEDLSLAHADADRRTGWEVAGPREYVNNVLSNLTYERCGVSGPRVFFEEKTLLRSYEKANTFQGFDAVTVQFGEGRYLTQQFVVSVGLGRREGISYL